MTDQEKEAFNTRVCCVIYAWEEAYDKAKASLPEGASQEQVLEARGLPLITLAEIKELKGHIDKNTPCPCGSGRPMRTCRPTEKYESKPSHWTMFKEVLDITVRSNVKKVSRKTMGRSGCVQSEVVVEMKETEVNPSKENTMNANGSQILSAYAQSLNMTVETFENEVVKKGVYILLKRTTKTPTQFEGWMNSHKEEERPAVLMQLKAAEAFNALILRDVYELDRARFIAEFVNARYTHKNGDHLFGEENANKFVSDLEKFLNAHKDLKAGEIPTEVWYKKFVEMCSTKGTEFWRKTAEFTATCKEKAMKTMKTADAKLVEYGTYKKVMSAPKEGEKPTARWMRTIGRGIVTTVIKTTYIPARWVTVKVVVPAAKWTYKKVLTPVGHFFRSIWNWLFSKKAVETPAAAPAQV